MDSDSARRAGQLELQEFGGQVACEILGELFGAGRLSGLLRAIRQPLASGPTGRVVLRQSPVGHRAPESRDLDNFGLFTFPDVVRAVGLSLGDERVRGV